MDWQLVWDSLGPIALAGVLGTIPLSLASFAVGMVLALLLALARMSPILPLSLASRFVISLVRGTPLLLQLFIVFYGLPLIGLKLEPWPSAILALSINVGAYAAEVVRASILSVPAGQWEAGYTVGMSRALTLRRIIIPQAARVSVPPLSNTFISLVKDTSLASLILVNELFAEARKIAAFSQEFLVLYATAGLVYWVICLVLSTAQVRLEKRLDRYVAHA
ncbi:amino acid ABC transporter permease [Homoserinibacter sp. YIM 151385]|uniref:amino acid ABC transporter permease n=1 Tax=Homoserinibacter sp. YIM 151385 TaxID=2985506 RepID=UPI0022F0C55D|nr:amino acid ABC transporter permease [Homoserinibacter sp. YIM 151385]WBU37165.1 amino acid ABC transporter permease [Homoserinibacter sp. YIM 151385]